MIYVQTERRFDLVVGLSVNVEAKKALSVPAWQIGEEFGHDNLIV